MAVEVLPNLLTGLPWARDPISLNRSHQISAGPDTVVIMLFE